MDIRPLFHLRYDPIKFHCVHFVIAAAKHIYQLDYSQCFIGLTGSIDETLKTSRETVHRNKLIKRPIEGCIVLMTHINGSSHVGLFFRHKVFHLTEQSVQRITLHQAGKIFKRIRYYEPNLYHQ
ncbi:hypothetical protein NL42_14010 [Acinetobacter sp. GN11]